MREEHLLPYCGDVHADLSLFWSRRSFSRFCHALAQFSFNTMLPAIATDKALFSSEKC